MKKTNTNKGLKKLIPAAGMLMLSAAMLGTSTFAWFTMNKEVSVTGMEVKAHAEEGLLVNEVEDKDSDFWDELATAKYTSANAIALRPASTRDLSAWWHANSLKSSNEAGYGSGTVDTTNTAKVDANNYYSNIGGNNVTEYTVQSAQEGVQAKTDVYYKDAVFGGPSGAYQDGEGFYVMYTYYLKSSSTSDLTISAGHLMVDVDATVNAASTGSGTAALDKAIRVGVKFGNDVLIFVPNGGDTSYKVTNDAAGSAYTSATVYTTETAINTADATIPKVDSNGTPVYVYVWFEGEDSNCLSDNLAADLDSIAIDVHFRDADLD